jgi:aryl-alcohol dehydrogenase-like predicted oxidoreductase
MEYIKLGNTGLDVSKICLGCMGFGHPQKWELAPWILDEEQSMPIIKKAFDLGINFFDTANIYSRGASEEVLGKAVKKYANRDEVVIATKVYHQVREGPNGQGLSRKHIMSEIDNSLKRLDMDYVDLYIIHRWDYNTPIEETMEALHDVVKAGKARYIGASAMFAWQFQKALHIAEKHGWTRFVSIQNHYNLMYREEEREMIPLCKEEKIAVTPYSPLASGRLVRDWSVTTNRTENDKVAVAKYGATMDVDRPIYDRVAEFAGKKGLSKTQIALGWLMSKGAIPIVGATKIAHVDEAVAAIQIALTDEEAAYLEEPYIPHSIVGPL